MNRMANGGTVKKRFALIWWNSPLRRQSERRMAILALGAADALREKRMTAREAWEIGLNFKTYRGLKSIKADRRLLELIEWAMELPQVEKLGDAAMEESVGHIQELAKSVLAAPSKRIAVSHSKLRHAKQSI
jgi:hypothetical protein